jgi:hypothetical protein
MDINTDSEIKTTSVYYDAQVSSKTLISHEKIIPKRIQKKLKVLTNGSNTGKSKNATEQIIEAIKKAHQCDVELIIENDTKALFSRIHNRDYDVRIGTVDAGTHPGKWVTEMMFCSKQGISFIDPMDEICSGLKNLSDKDSEAVGKLVNETIAKHKSLIPLYNKSFLTYVGEDLDPKTVTSNTPSIRFELIKAIR